MDNKGLVEQMKEIQHHYNTVKTNWVDFDSAFELASLKFKNK